MTIDNKSRIRWVSLLLAVLLALGMVLATGQTPVAQAAIGDITLFTPYTDLSVAPGETINYNIELINNTNKVQNAVFTLEGPTDWEHSLNSGGWEVSQISIKPKSQQTVNLDLDVPLKVEQGVYRIRLIAQDKGILPLTVRVTERGTFSTEFKTEQSNMHGNAGSVFNFSATLRNRTAEKQLYALTSDAPRGWSVTFNENGNNVTSVQLEKSASKSVTVDVKPPEGVTSGSYSIPIRAVSGGTSAALDLEVVITGSFKVELTTPSGKLSTDVTAGGTQNVDLLVNNTGSSAIPELKLSATAPAGWEVTFEPQRVQGLEPGQSATVQATLKSSNKSISGDYLTILKAESPEASSEAQFRVTVQTSVLWGWLGILIIALVIGGVVYLFRKYGRR